MTAPAALQALNEMSDATFVSALDGIYEHSSWVAQAVAGARPFASVSALAIALADAVRGAGRERQLALLRAHPELAGKAAVAGELTPASLAEQQRAGLAHCSPAEYAEIHRLNAAYRDRFGWPFIVAVRGDDGEGLGRAQIISTMHRRLANPPETEFRECLRQVDRIAQLRLVERFGVASADGARVLRWADDLACHTEVPGELTVTYCTPAHRETARALCDRMRDCGFDEVRIDAVGNVVGRYRGEPAGTDAGDASTPALLTGSHYDTVRGGGRYDGRLGILAPMAAVARLAAARRRLPFDLEVVGFAEEEGVRFRSTFLGSSALTGRFDPGVLDSADRDGTTMRDAMREAGLDPRAIASLARDPQRLIGFVEVHIEQGPVLLERGLPLGVVTSINGGVRILVEIEGLASHAGTTPMNARHDAACAGAELALYVERRCACEPDLVGTVGQFQVPNGSINVVPGRCELSLDIRAPRDAQRDAAVLDILDELRRIAERRGVRTACREVMRAAAAPADPVLRDAWRRAVRGLGLPAFELPSGAGHDAMHFDGFCPQAMLFVRCGNGGISHNALETITREDAQLAVDAFLALLDDLATSTKEPG